MCNHSLKCNTCPLQSHILLQHVYIVLVIVVHKPAYQIFLFYIIIASSPWPEYAVIIFIIGYNVSSDVNPHAQTTISRITHCGLPSSASSKYSRLLTVYRGMIQLSYHAVKTRDLNMYVAAPIGNWYTVCYKNARYAILVYKKYNGGRNCFILYLRWWKIFSQTKITYNALGVSRDDWANVWRPPHPD
jgi:hypothetical protein